MTSKIKLFNFPCRYVADSRWRVRILCGSLLFLSVAQILVGFVNSYWQLVVLRCLIGTAEGAFQPITGAIISSNFGSASARGMSVFNWGIYIGLSLSFLLSKLFEVEEIFGLDWRGAYKITGAFGLIVAPGMLFFVQVKVYNNFHNL